MKRNVLITLLLLVLNISCASTPTAPPIAAPTPISVQVATATVTQVVLPTVTATQTATLTDTATPTFTQTSTPSPIPTEVKIPSLEELGARLVWRSPVSTQAIQNWDGWNTPQQNAWDYLNEIGGKVEKYNDPEVGDVLRYRLTEKRDMNRVELDENGTVLHGNIAVRLKFRLGKDYKVLTPNGTANLLTNNLLDPHKGAPTWIILGNVDFDYQRRLQLILFDPVAGNKVATYKSANVVLDSNKWYVLEFRAYSNEKSLQVLIDGKPARFRVDGKELSLVPSPPNTKEITLSQIHGGAYGYELNWQADGEVWIDNGQIEIFNW